MSQIQVYSASNTVPTATVVIQNHENEYTDSAPGDGPVNAVFNAIDRALNFQSKVESYQVRSVTAGREALGEVLVRIRHRDLSFTGRGISTDVIEASAKAYLQAINQKEKYKRENEKIKEEPVAMVF